MSPINYATIVEKVKLLEDVVRKLSYIKNQGREKFFSDSIFQDAAIRNLALGVEIIVDTGNHILAEAFHKPAKEYRDIIVQLGASGVIPKEFSREHQSMAGFRHVLIHDYADIDYELVYKHLERAPDNFSAFAKYYIAFLEKSTM